MSMTPEHMFTPELWTINDLEVCLGRYKTCAENPSLLSMDRAIARDRAQICQTWIDYRKSQSPRIAQTTVGDVEESTQKRCHCGAWEGEPCVAQSEGGKCTLEWV